MIDISNILGKKEGLHLEAKSARGGFPDSFWESYSAFANTDGGVILLGVEEKPDHSLYVTDGLTDAEKMKNDFWNMVNNRQKVSHNIVTNSMVYVVQIEGKNILVVEVPRAERTIRPVYKGQDPRNGTFRRWNEGDHLCSVEEVGSILRDASFSATTQSMAIGMFSKAPTQTTSGIRLKMKCFFVTSTLLLWPMMGNIIQPRQDCSCLGTNTKSQDTFPVTSLITRKTV